MKLNVDEYKICMKKTCVNLNSFVNKNRMHGVMEG